MITTLTLLALLVAALLGGESRGVPVPLAAESVLRLEGGSTIRDWSCSTSSLRATMIEGSGRPSRATVSGELRVPVATLDCGDERMESDLRTAVREGEHPDIAFLLTEWELAPEGEGFRGVARGELTLAGQVRPVEVAVRGEHDPSGGARATGRTDLLMTSFGITPPSAFFGLIKARDQVVVRFDLRVDAATAARLRTGPVRMVAEP